MIGRPNRRGNRPSALDFSFGIEDPDDSASTTSGATSDASRKRDRGDAGDPDARGTKRRNLDGAPQPPRKYEPRSYEVEETRDLLVFGEEQDPPGDDRKRVRALSHFTFFDPRHENRMVSLDVLDEGGDDQRVRGAGFVSPLYDVDEDAGQEDDLDEEAERQYIRTTRILKYFTKYWERDSPFYVETAHAIYELRALEPSKKYRSQFRPFWRLQTILRFVISSAREEPEQEFVAFMREYNRIIIFDQPMTERELWDAVPKLRETLENVPYGDALRASPVIHHLLFRLPPVIFRPVGGRQGERRPQPENDLHVQYKGTLDLAVLRTPLRTRVTPRIGQMARGLFREVLDVVGRPPRAEPEMSKDELTPRLETFLMHTQTRPLVQFRPNQKIGRSSWLKHILIDGLTYEVGDTVLFYSGTGIPPNPNDLPPTDTLADHFWFAKIIYMSELDGTVHVQWFEHSSKTLLQELGHPQELFLIDHCNTQLLRLIIGKVSTHYIKPGDSVADIQSHDFFYRYLWDQHEGSFTNVDMDALAASARDPPPYNCPACKIAKKFDEGTEVEKVHLGIRWHGKEYHLDDCVLIKADEGPCHIGQILRFNHGRGHDNVDVVVRLFGRTDRVGSRPDTTLKDERHLFLTDDEMTTTVHDLIDVCYVVVKDNMPELDTWLAMCPRRFYVEYRFPSLSVVSWASRRRVHWGELPVCHVCAKQDLKTFRGTKTFLETEAPLRVFDPFAGTGAFCLAMEEVGCFKLTHAVEISPSAAETLRNNTSPDVKVYNQCSNLILRHAILTHENKHPEPLKSIEDKVLPPFPKPGDIDCLVTGFPCQPHSTLNMYQKVEDKKSNLILTALSFVDFLKPQYCIFENVRGFLNFNLRAHRRSEHSVKGGIPLGGLKLVVAALLDMGYQLQSSLLQAGHYGTPQTRVRFFLIAAKGGLKLPPFPQPTHDFPVSDKLEIKFPDGLTFDPITTLPGVAPHRYVSVHDAISDLPKFDWKHPKQQLNRRQMEENRVKECLGDLPWCGFHGPDVPYEHEPHTRFQKWCRSQPTPDIQQYTRTYDAKKVERVVEIPVEADADYRHLRPELWEWQLVNPQSSVARRGFRAGFYGRVQRDGWFPATVTNVDPTAKQSRVIHPYNRRIVTVRELARAQGFPDHFVFHAQEKRVVTMHRQIGNAVPWPLSMAIAREFRDTLYKDWVERNPVPEPSDEEFTDEDGDADGDAMQVD